jgi:hypothetical protein
VRREGDEGTKRLRDEETFKGKSAEICGISLYGNLQERKSLACHTGHYLRESRKLIAES